MARTDAGEVLASIAHSHISHAMVPGTFIEGEKETASMWVRDEFSGKYFQIHVTELHPTESELAFYKAE